MQSSDVMQLMEDQPWSSSKLRRRTCAFLDTKVQASDEDLQMEVSIPADICIRALAV